MGLCGVVLAEGRSRHAASLVLTILALVPVVLAAPAAASAKQLECPHPEISEAAQPTPAVVGIPWQAAATFWCLEAGDQLASPSISWGDGTVSAGVVSYSELERSTVIDGDVLESVMVRTGQIMGSHVYARVPSGPHGGNVTLAATDSVGGAVLTSYKHAFVLPRDLARKVPLPATGNEVAGALALVRVAYDAFDPYYRLTARIDWGDGQHSRGSVAEGSHKVDTGTVLYTIRGHHRWRHKGPHTITVLITDEVGPQHLVVRDHAS